MGVFDIFENKKRTHEKAYGRGASDGSKSRWFADVVHDFKHGQPLFGKRNTYDKSHDAGYHEGRRGKRQRERASTV
ncbi:MAG: hypothetical protein QOE77_3292 [Blastocatellia bacterium]|nr:hypothetical protein [Blastocatellia bacterium]